MIEIDPNRKVIPFPQDRPKQILGDETSMRVVRFVVFGAILDWLACIFNCMVVVAAFTINPLTLLAIVPGVMGQSVGSALREGVQRSFFEHILPRATYTIWVPNQPVGITNPKWVSCWFNSMLQVVRNTPSMFTRIQECCALQLAPNSPYKTFQDALKQAFNGYEQCLVEHEPEISGNEVLPLLQAICERIEQSPGQQQDASEGLKLLELVDEVIASVQENPAVVLCPFKAELRIEVAYLPALDGKFFDPFTLKRRDRGDLSTEALRERNEHILRMNIPQIQREFALAILQTDGESFGRHLFDSDEAVVEASVNFLITALSATPSMNLNYLKTFAETHRDLPDLLPHKITELKAHFNQPKFKDVKIAATLLVDLLVLARGGPLHQQIQTALLKVVRDKMPGTSNEIISARSLINQSIQNLCVSDGVAEGVQVSQANLTAPRHDEVNLLTLHLPSREEFAARQGNAKFQLAELFTRPHPTDQRERTLVALPDPVYGQYIAENESNIDLSSEDVFQIMFYEACEALVDADPIDNKEEVKAQVRIDVRNYLARKYMENQELTDCAQLGLPFPCQPIKEKLTIAQPQEEMVIKLVRESRVNNVTSKIGDPIDIPLELEVPLEAYDSTQLREAPRYELTSFIQHIGQGAGGGHYVSYIKKDGCWWFCNDSAVDRVRDLSKMKHEASLSYLFHYARIPAAPQALQI